MNISCPTTTHRQYNIQRDISAECRTGSVSVIIQQSDRLGKEAVTEPGFVPSNAPIEGASPGGEGGEQGVGRVTRVRNNVSSSAFAACDIDVLKPGQIIHINTNDLGCFLNHSL